jgi:hypothetical protein
MKKLQNKFPYQVNYFIDGDFTESLYYEIQPNDKDVIEQMEKFKSDTAQVYRCDRNGYGRFICEYITEQSL